MRGESFVGNYIYSTKDIYFEILFLPHQEKWRRLLIREHNVEVLAVPRGRHAKVIVSDWEW